jgi:hypothetical protein
MIAVFMTAICFPAARNLSGADGGPASSENRKLATRPRLTWSGDAVKSFPASFDAFYNDNFGCRYTLIRMHNLAAVRGFHVSPSANVCLGKRGWLFYTEDRVGADYHAARPFRGDELLCWQRVLETRRNWLAKQGIRYLFVIAPDKASIYPEVLPNALQRRLLEPTRLDQLMAHMLVNSDVKMLDLRQPLRDSKAGERVFYITDSHWNSRGCYAGYRTIVESLTEWFPNVKAMPRAAFDEVVMAGPGGDLARMLSLEDRFPESDLELVPRTPRHARRVATGYSVPRLPPPMQPVVMEQQGRGLPRAVVFRDSFGSCLIPYLSEHFRRVVYSWQEAHGFDAALIQRERPDVVVQEIVERKLATPVSISYPAGVDDPFAEAPDESQLARGANDK